MAEPSDKVYAMIADALSENLVIPFFGAGVNRCGRPKGKGWQPGEFLPDGGELAEHLADKFRYPRDDDRRDLLRVSQYAELMLGSGRLYKALRDLLNVDYPPTDVHRFFAKLPALRRGMGAGEPSQLIITTNYDDLMERAFNDEGEPFDMLTYVADDKKQRGKFLHTPHGQSPRVIEEPQKYLDLPLGKRSIILKIHGAIDRADETRDSFVITENHYIDYLTRIDILKLLPATIVSVLRNRHFLFLGYSLRDWNLRVILYLIWGEQRLTWKSWAVQLKPQEVDEEFWRQRDVETYDLPLEVCITELSSRMRSLAGAEVKDE